MMREGRQGGCELTIAGFHGRQAQARRAITAAKSSAPLQGEGTSSGVGTVRTSFSQPLRAGTSGMVWPMVFSGELAFMRPSVGW